MILTKQIIFFIIVQNIISNYSSNLKRASRRNFLSSRRIVGGQQANAEDWPFMVAILSAEEKQQVGGSVLISPQCILTAAHVVSREGENGSWVAMDNDELYLQMGSNRLDTGYINRQIENIIIYPEYSSENIFHDLALIMLDEPVFKDSTVDYIKLSNGTPSPGITCKTAGWGETLQKNNKEENPEINEDNWDDFFPKNLLEVYLPLIDHSECKEHLYDAFKVQYPDEEFDQERLVSNNALCTMVAEGGKDTCQGDSGGPLVCDDNILAAVTSWGQGCALPNVPGVFTDVFKYKSWIKDTCERESKPITRSAAINISELNDPLNSAFNRNSFFDIHLSKENGDQYDSEDVDNQQTSKNNIQHGNVWGSSHRLTPTTTRKRRCTKKISHGKLGKADEDAAEPALGGGGSAGGGTTTVAGSDMTTETSDELNLMLNVFNKCFLFSFVLNTLLHVV